jgi:hypothetical protein
MNKNQECSPSASCTGDVITVSDTTDSNFDVCFPVINPTKRPETMRTETRSIKLQLTDFSRQRI